MFLKRHVRTRAGKRHVYYSLTEDEELTAFNILQRQALRVSIPTRQTRTRTDCPRRDPVTGQIREQSPRVLADGRGETTRSFAVNSVSTGRVVFSKVSPTELQGTVTGTRLDGLGEVLVNVPYQWEFHLKRRQE